MDPGHRWPVLRRPGVRSRRELRHGAEPSADGKLVFLSYWDSGFVRLRSDGSCDPGLHRSNGLSHECGWGRSFRQAVRRRSNLLFGADEDFLRASGASIESGYGYMRVYDYSTPAAPVQIGEQVARRTRSARTTRRPATSPSTTTSWWAPTCTAPGTRTASGWWTRAT